MNYKRIAKKGIIALVITISLTAYNMLVGGNNGYIDFIVMFLVIFAFFSLVTRE